MNIRIVPFRPADQAAVRALIEAGLAERWGYLNPDLNPDLRNIGAAFASGGFVVAKLGDEVLGCGGFQPEAPEVCRIVRLWVRQSARRRGIGTMLLRRLLGDVEELGYRRVLLETATEWHDAVAFYLANGFRLILAEHGDSHFERVLGGPCALELSAAGRHIMAAEE